jgi:cyclic pyranopterin phosphate synthase
MSKLSHLDEQGAARMVDVSAKTETARAAMAESTIVLSADAFAAVMAGSAPKGDVLAAARIAGIMAAKRVPDLIPLCHPLPITGAELAFEAADNRIRITATVKTVGKTGVEMEALTAAAVAALTVYDMVKAIDKEAVIGDIRLVSKTGGKSGTFTPHGRAQSGDAKAAGTVPVNKSAAMGDSPRQTAPRGGRAKPKVLMGEVFAPPAAGGRDARREAFRAFMTGRRLRASRWAKEAGVPLGEIMGYLTGQSRGFSQATLEKLAKAARVSPEDMFG